MEMNEEIKKFSDQTLKEIIDKPAAVTVSEGNASLNKLSGKLIETSKQENLEKISKQFVVEKFIIKNENANHWIEIIGKQYKRFNVEVNAFNIMSENP